MSLDNHVDNHLALYLFLFICLLSWAYALGDDQNKLKTSPCQITSAKGEVVVE